MFDQSIDGKIEDVSKFPNFNQANSLIRRNNSTSHKISDITGKLHNLELKIIIIEKQQTFMTKKGLITQCLVADQSGSIFMNFYNETGKYIREGDVLYLNGVYSSKYKQMVLLYEGDYSMVKRVGKKSMGFNLTRNLSQQSLEHYGEYQQQKKLKFSD